jgi:hypothetical protein
VSDAASAERPGSGSRRLLALAALLYLGLRGALLFTPGYDGDMRWYRGWALAAVRHGVTAVYRESHMDYPPLYAYVLAPLGHAYVALVPSELERRPRGDLRVWTALVKLPPLVADIAIAALLFAVARRRAEPSPAWRAALPAAYLLNPAVVFDTGYWGQPDSIHAFFVLASLLLVSGPAWALAWPALALGALMKPLAAPFAPLLLAAGLVRQGLRRTLLGLGLGLATAVLVFAPFLLAGEGPAVAARVLGDLDILPFTSVNAHNLWWALGPWREARAPLLGPLTATRLGLLLFAGTYGAILVRGRALWREDSGEDLVPALGAAVAASFFMLATHMHENHLFQVLPLLVVLLPRGRAFGWLYALVSLAVLANLVLHDPLIPGRWPFTLGGETALVRSSHSRSFFEAELLAVRAAVAFNLALFPLALHTLLRGGPSQAPLARTGD